MTAAKPTLRDPFPSEQIGKLPRSTCRDCSNSPRKRCDRHTWVANCSECHGGHSSATMHLDYVGHADVTDRLLSVDPSWTWEPMALGPDGLPALDRDHNLWIRLTVNGVTRIGVGDGKNAKERIGDALRNAAMRFGVALDLWAKGDRHYGEEGQAADRDSDPDGELSRPVERHQGNPGPDAWTTPDPLAALKHRIWSTANAVGIKDKASLAAYYAEQMGGLVLADAGEDELTRFLEVLTKAKEAA